MGKYYGKELILDLHHCDPKQFNRKALKRFFVELCDLIDMQRCDLHFWDDYGVPVAKRQTAPHLKGTSAIQFIMTSNVTIHTLDLLGNVYLNIFSCKNFDTRTAVRFCETFFEGKAVTRTVISRR